MKEETEEIEHVTRLEKFLKSGFAHSVFKVYYDDDKEYYLKIIDGLFKPTDEEKDKLIKKHFGKDITRDMIFSCHNCEGKFSASSIKWINKSTPKCARYPLCPSHWTDYDLNFHSLPPKIPKKSKRCRKHKQYKAEELPTNMCPSCMEAYGNNKDIPYDEVKELCQKEESKKYEVCYHCKQVDGENCTFCEIRRSNK